MGIKNQIRLFVEGVIGRKIIKEFPLGVNPLVDVIRWVPQSNFKVVFDVGANVGQSAKSFKEYFPAAKIYCFEPVPLTCKELRKNLSEYKDIKIFEIGFGSSSQRATIQIGTSSDLSSIVIGDYTAHGNSQVIELDTLTNFCAVHGVRHIDYMKIDTEGFDLEVIAGAKGLMDNHSVDFIELVCCHNRAVRCCGVRQMVIVKSVSIDSTIWIIQS